MRHVRWYFPFLATFLAPSAAMAADVGALSRDCTEVKVEYADDKTLTKSERLARMDDALMDSLSKFDECAVNQAAGGSSADSASGGTSAAAGGDPATAAAQANNGGMSGTEDSENDAFVPPGNVVSSAASGMSGTEEAPKPAEATGGWSDPDDAEKDGRNRVGNVASSNGKLPDDIPPADNDSVLEAQIRRAAMEETDPEVKAKLWNEYRKYKGLPPK